MRIQILGLPPEVTEAEIVELVGIGAHVARIEVSPTEEWELATTNPFAVAIVSASAKNGYGAIKRWHGATYRDAVLHVAELNSRVPGALVMGLAFGPPMLGILFAVVAFFSGFGNFSEIGVSTDWTTVYGQAPLDLGFALRLSLLLVVLSWVVAGALAIAEWATVGGFMRARRTRFGVPPSQDARSVTRTHWVWLAAGVALVLLLGFGCVRPATYRTDFVIDAGARSLSIAERSLGGDRLRTYEADQIGAVTYQLGYDDGQVPPSATFGLDLRDGEHVDLTKDFPRGFRGFVDELVTATGWPAICTQTTRLGAEEPMSCPWDDAAP